MNSKISVTCTSCGSCQQLRLTFSLRTHRISIRLHMQDHNIPLCLLIISVYILTVLVLWNMFSNGHVMVTSCLFLWYNPSTNPMNSVHLVWEAGTVLMHISECQYFALFTLQNGDFWWRLWSRFRKVIFISILHVISFFNYFKTTLRPN